MERIQDLEVHGITLNLKFDKAFEYENNFYHTSSPSRINKMIAHYELFKKSINVPGDIVECGVFKGASLIRFATFRKLFGQESKKIIGFDTFREYPEANYEPDKELRNRFIESAGMNSVGMRDLRRILKHKNLNKNIELIDGDICETIPKYVDGSLKISLLNLDVDLYYPTVITLGFLWTCINNGGILILDDYNTFPGETRAVNEYFKNKDVEIKKSKYYDTMYYIIK